ncbi:MAG TPA: glycosyltransferase, partial [Mycobacteriales bacterium]
MTPRRAGMTGPTFAVVVPTVDRPSLRLLLASLADQNPAPAEVVVADDRRLPPGSPGPDVGTFAGARIVRSGGRGPAAARNAGWRCTRAHWVVTVDDDVVLPDGWSQRLVEDLAAYPYAGAIAGRITVPAPVGHRPTDWERTTAGLQNAWWATADMAFRRAALVSVGGFDERFRRAYREDADVALRLRKAGWPLAVGSRQVVHPVRTAGRWVSVRAQRGNADDALMRRLHGADWRGRARCPRGRLRW